MENRPVVLGNQDGGTPPNAAPALYVLVKQPQITGKADQGDLVSNQEDNGLASSIATPVKSKVKTCLPADCTSGSITVTLDNNNMWNEFYYRGTEMILTKQGRRMFPYCRYWITGLDSKLKYILVVDISPVDNLRYKWNGHSWEPSGKAEPHVLGRVFIHPESPSTGRYWMHQPVSFYKLKLTNNTLDQEGHIILHSMHRYLPRLHLVPADKATEVIQLNGPDVHTFIFPQTEFFAVTAYQNIQITQLKIDYNPFAKGFRDDGLSSRFQRDVKQNGSSDQEGGSVNSSPSHHRHLTESEIFDPEQRDLETSLSAMCNTDLDRESISPYHDFLGFMETDTCDSPILKQEAPESPIASPCQSHSHVASPLNSNGGINVVVKEEPADDYDYGPSVCMEEIDVKQEEARNMAEEYSNRVDSILEKRRKNHREVGKKEMEFESRKRPQTNQLGVAKAKMLKLDSGKLPVVYLAPCSVTKNTVKVSALSQAILSLSKSAESPLSHPLDYLPTCFENSSVSSPFTSLETEEMLTRKQVSENNVPHKSPTARDVRWKNTETCNSLTITKKVSSCGLKATAYRGPSLANLVGGKTNAFKNHISRKSIVGNQKVRLPGPRKRGRPRKIRFSEVGRPPKYTRKSITTSNYASFGPGNIHLDVKPDLEDVDGVLFVSFASKVILFLKFKVVRSTKYLSNLNMYFTDSQRIPQLETELLEELKSYKYKQVIHPSLREVGLKLNLVDPTMSIDLKYLGVQLPLSYSDEYTLWKNARTNSSSYDTGLPFVSRTGKTNDFTKIKGWRGKLHSSSKNEGSILEGSLKNRSAFCSDKLDEYLENEGKLMETSMEFSPSTSSCPVVYQLPTKSTSYVRTLDSVLKKQSSVTTTSSYTFKPLSVPSVSRKKREKIKNKKQAGSRGKEKSPQKATIGLPVVTKQKRNLTALEEKVTKSQPSSQAVSEIDALMASGTEENVPGKQRQAQQQQQSNRLPSLSKTQLKLMDLEVCALWDGKPRTYITEERADLSLSTLLTAQASLKNKPIHQIIKRRAPPCNNDFCRLGCICSSLALEKRQPTHCRKPDCMFGCACLKRKVVLVKGSSKEKKILEESLCGRNRLYCESEVKQQEEVMEKEEKKEKLKFKDKKKKKKVEYTICGTEPEKPVKNFPLWVKVDGETDPEPVYIPTPSTIEPAKSTPPVPEVLTSNGKPAAGEGKPATSGVKSARVYAPRPNPVIREEDKDPVYIYFESMMTCARVRIYDRKKQEKKQQQKYLAQSPSKSIFNLLGFLCCCNTTETCFHFFPDKTWWFSCSAGDPSTSYVHHTTRGGTTKLIEIVSDCNWEEDRNEILNILSQHVKSKMPKSLKVGNFVIDLESETKSWDEKNTPVYSSRVKISMLSSQNKGEKAPISVLEASDNRLSPCKKTEKITFLTAGMLRERRKKGLPFYAGLSPAGKLIAYTCKSDLNSSSLIQVESDAKLASSEPQSAEMPTTEISKTPFPSNTTSTSTVTSPNAHASTQKQIAARPLLHNVASQLVISAVGALHQKVPGTRISQPLTGPQKFNIKSMPLSPGATTVTPPAITVSSLAGTTASPAPCNKAPCSSGTAKANAVGKPENRTVSTTATRAPVKIAKSPGIATPVATVALPAIGPSTIGIPVSAASLSTILTTTASVTSVPTPTSPVSCIAPGLSGINKSPLSNQKAGKVPLLMGQFLLVHTPVTLSVMRDRKASVLPRTPTTETPLMLPVLPTASPISSATEAPSGLSMSPASAVSCAAEAPSASTMAPPTDQTSQAIGSGPTLPISAAQTEPVISPVSQAGTLTMRISPLGVSQTTSDSKITCDTSSTPDSADHLIALQSGSFALLQVPGQKKVPNSIMKQVEVNSTSQNDELSSLKPEGKTRCLQEVEAMGSEVTMSDSRQEENKLPENHLEPSCEKLTCDRNAITSEKAEKDAEILKELSSDDPILESEIASLDRSYISQEIKPGGNKVMANVKHPEDTPNEVSCSSESVTESCSQTAVLAHDALNEQKVAQLKNSNEEEAHSEQTQSTATDSEGVEQKQLETDEEMIIEPSQKPWDECKVQTNCAEKLERKTKSYLSPRGNEDQELLGQNMKERGHSVAAQRDRGEVRRKHKVTSANGQNTTLGSKYVNNALEFSYKRDTGVQKDNLTVKDSLVQVNKSWSKTLRPSDALENKNKNGADEFVKKFPKCEKQQNILKTSYHRKDSLPAIINITMDNTEKDEKTDDSADEMADEASGYQSEDIVNSESESNGSEENVDIETVEELTEQINIARLKATAAHVILSKQLSCLFAFQPQPELPNKKPKNEEETFSNYRETHTANERRRRKEMRRLFEKLKVTLGLQMVPKVSKCFILKQALEEIQGLTDQADKLLGQKNLLMRKQDTLIRKVSALSGKTQEVVLKKLEYIYAKQKAVEAQKKQQQAEAMDVVETLETAKPSVENSPSSLFKEMKPATLSRDIPMTLTNASLVMTANGQVLAFKSPLVPGQVAAFPSTLLQTDLKSEADSSNGAAQPESEDSFMMPRIVNVTSLATEEDTNLNLDANKNPDVTLDTDSQTPESSLQVVSHKTTDLRSPEEAEPSSVKGRGTTGAVHDSLKQKENFPQITNVSSLKASPEPLATKPEELAGNQARLKQMNKGSDGQKSKESSFQKLQINEPNDSGIEMELQKVASAIHEPALDASDLMGIEETDDTDETLTSLLNEIAFLNQQLNDDASDISELPNSLSSGFTLGDMESRRQSTTAEGSPFPFGAMSGSFKDLSIVQESSDSITPLLLHLDDDDLPDGNKNSGDPSSDSDALKIMLGSEAKDPNPDHSAANSCGSGKTEQSAAKTRSVSPPILQMKTNLEAGKADLAWRPMPKLAPLGLKAANFPLESEGQNTKVMPSLAPVASKEIKTAQPVTSPSQDGNETLTLAPEAAESKYPSHSPSVCRLGILGWTCT
uniref:MAX gene-associated protein n=1 Tax=Podarcis muralis TaxID=64176 RepID=A0A670HT36_PODMU